MSEEVWNPVVGYEGFYEVSSFGRVRSLDRIVYDLDGRRTRIFKGKELSLLKGKYLTVCLFKPTNRRNGTKHKAETKSVHSLVAISFIGEPPIGSEVMHLDGNPYNNYVCNLRYGSRMCNNAFKKEHGTNNPGSKNPMSKLSVEDVGLIKEMINNKNMINVPI